MDKSAVVCPFGGGTQRAVGTIRFTVNQLVVLVAPLVIPSVAVMRFIGSFFSVITIGIHRKEFSVAVIAFYSAFEFAFDILLLHSESPVLIVPTGRTIAFVVEIVAAIFDISMRPERRRIGMVGRISALGLSSGIETLASQLSVGVICFHGAVELSVDVSRSLGNGQSAVYGVIFAIPAVAYPFFDLCRKEIREKGLSYNSGLFESARKGPAIRDRADKPGGAQ